MIRLGLIIICLVLWTLPAIGSETAEVEQILKERLDAVTAVLANQDMSPEDKNEAIVAAVEPVFDFNVMAKLTLGKRHWPKLSAAERKQFTHLFKERLKKTYLSKLNLYTDEEIVYGTATASKKKVIIPTEVLSKGNTISLIYKFYRSKQGWRIYDMTVQDISLVKSYRAQYDAFLKEKPFEALLKELQAPIKE